MIHCIDYNRIAVYSIYHEKIMFAEFDFTILLFGKHRILTNRQASGNV